MTALRHLGGVLLLACLTFGCAESNERDAGMDASSPDAGGSDSGFVFVPCDLSVCFNSCCTDPSVHPEPFCCGRSGLCGPDGCHCGSGPACPAHLFCCGDVGLELHGARCIENQLDAEACTYDGPPE